MDSEKSRGPLLTGNMAPDITDAYIKKHGGDQYGGQQQLYTFRKCTTGRSAGEDFQSDTSGETTASDSGRGGSEEDIQLPPLPEMSVDTSRMVFSHSPENLSKDRRFMYTNNPHDPEAISFETFSPRMLPSYGHHLPRDPGAPTAFRDVHTLGNTRPYAAQERKLPADISSSSGRRTQRPPPHTQTPPTGSSPTMKETTFGGKRVTFKNDLNAKNLQTLDLVHKMAPSPLPLEDVTPFRGGGDDRSPGGYCPSITRSHDDDDTTTSGSYTLNVEDDLDDLPPPVGYSLA
ncbi:uncharacterized protein LOC112558510 [Pomacea canaliculata]|nr:uncharacterized protein LOC112558510 [Pomacea canaliculata]